MQARAMPCPGTSVYVNVVLPCVKACDTAGGGGGPDTCKYVVPDVARAFTSFVSVAATTCSNVRLHYYEPFGLTLTRARLCAALLHANCARHTRPMCRTPLSTRSCTQQLAVVNTCTSVQLAKLNALDVYGCNSLCLQPCQYEMNAWSAQYVLAPGPRARGCNSCTFFNVATNPANSHVGYMPVVVRQQQQRVGVVQIEGRQKVVVRGLM